MQEKRPLDSRDLEVVVEQANATDSEERLRHALRLILRVAHTEALAVEPEDDAKARSDDS